MLKMYQNLSCIYQTGMNGQRKFIFLQNSLFGIQNTYSSEFSIGQSISETLLLKCEASQSYFF